jgi:hypothetical protein
MIVSGSVAVGPSDATIEVRGDRGTPLRHYATTGVRCFPQDYLNSTTERTFSQRACFHKVSDYGNRSLARSGIGSNMGLRRASWNGARSCPCGSAARIDKAGHYAQRLATGARGQDHRRKQPHKRIFSGGAQCEGNCADEKSGKH